MEIQLETTVTRVLTDGGRVTGVETSNGTIAAPSVVVVAGASAGGIRQQGRDPREWPLSLEASRRWPQLDQELGASTGSVQGGHLQRLWPAR